MHEPPVDAPAGTAAGFGPFGRALLAVSKAAAVVGGLVFVAIVAMSIVSIVGRKLVSMPVPGDFELVEMGSAVGASFFFAYCHLNRGDVKVDFFTQHWSAAKVMWLDADRPVRRGGCVAHGGGRVRAARGGRKLGDPRLADVGGAPGDGAGLRADGAGRLLHGRALRAGGTPRGARMSAPGRSRARIAEHAVRRIVP